MALQLGAAYMNPFDGAVYAKLEAPKAIGQ